MDMGGTICDVSVVTNGEHGRKDIVWVEWMIGARLQAYRPRQLMGQRHRIL